MQREDAPLGASGANAPDAHGPGPVAPACGRTAVAADGASTCDQARVRAAREALIATVAALPVYRLAIDLQCVTPVTLSEHPGSALRGALVQALLDAHCTNKQALSCATCPLVRVCPVSTLVAPLRDEAPRGRDVPRPFVITPPTDAPAELPADACWTFGLTLFGPAAELFPYVVLSRQRLEANGIGVRSESGRRGRVRVARITSITSREPITVFAPGLPRISTPAPCPARELIALRAAELPAERLRLRFDTPLRLKAEGEIVRTFQPAVFIHRILERWEGLRREYATPGTFELLGPLRGLPADPAAADPRALLAVADTVRVERDETRWLELASYSSRQRQFTPIGGLLGEVALAGDLQPLHDVLALGELIHVGKDVVKGNGCFTVLGTP